MPTLLTPIKAIRVACRTCMGGTVSEIPRCSDTMCPIWPYRMGRRPTKLTAAAYRSQDADTIQASMEALNREIVRSGEKKRQYTRRKNEGRLGAE